MTITIKGNEVSVKFGTGDIYMCDSEREGTGEPFGVFLVQDVPGQIGAYKETNREYSSDDIKPGQKIERLKKYTHIHITSTKPESIRELIRLLTNYEKSLKEAQTEENR
jgi:hypothetical protein